MPDIYFPGSDKPFRPVNPWGRAVPKVEKPIREQLYQLVVKRNGQEMRFGPKAGKEMIDQLHLAVETAVRLGVEKDLSDPHIVRVV